MTLEEILKRSESENYRDKYPDIFQDDCGLDIEWEPGNLRAVPSWGYRQSNTTRRATVKISSFRGISIGAIHYYATIDIQGVNMVFKNNPLCSCMNSECVQQHPLSAYIYRLRLLRAITEEEILEDQELGLELSRFYRQKAGDLTQSWISQEEIIEFAKEVFRQRFHGNWEFYVEYVNGKLEKLTI